MDALPEPLGMILEGFCHVEWWEVHELAELVQSGNARFDVGALKAQMEAKLADPTGIASPIHKLTLVEFESDEEARAWLQDIYQTVFGGSAS
ncbi:hypothetical protein [Steroidobacter cummioxidans]|uniref:hypothetical protein n=1 Tax=Steroidobacter cummioxidans TaxID=1803913 RepID=UPI000E31C96D|nr:hypothetical protein [Steroidobacter cummioxidans]